MTRKQQISPWVRQLGRSQLAIAERWRHRAAASSDCFARFYFGFTGFNALFFFWAEAERYQAEAHRRPVEREQIEWLIRTFSTKDSSHALADAQEAVRYFSERRAIQRMDRRQAENPHDGDPMEGGRLKEALADTHAPAKDRLVALARIIYLVRNNLVHGSKLESGDDEEVVEHAAKGLMAILDHAIPHTSGRLGVAPA